MSTIIDGKKIAKEVYAQIENRIAILKTNYHIVPMLAIVQVGKDPSSDVYVKMIRKKSDAIGIESSLFMFDDETSTEMVLSKIEALNADLTYSGIIVQFPVPKHIDEKRLREAIAPSKDVDSAGTRNIGKFYTSKEGFIPCTPKSMLHLLLETESDLAGKEAVVLGRSHVVGKPIADLLLAQNMTVTICHSKTKHLKEHIKRADVIMAATGKPRLVTADMVKSEAIVIDAGISVIDGIILGDVDYENVVDKVKAITPVPGGVGPLTIAMLMDNVTTACERQHHRET